MQTLLAVIAIWEVQLKLKSPQKWDSQNPCHSVSLGLNLTLVSPHLDLNSIHILR